ncbi:MAG: hypothetical protein COV91_03645 [Candidatus Taylorbacteria bacterium CG11_big_fil_rev_8_21_14_0_20_46_11]|uniref:Uncharacterized protein n=1 Tax=Candidatus Taylorbacteria bacterium CG11_big_fil_rev_8_21_14_0_20_46_11 TaxID=1975025 RepID=A0A2H0KB88_9BACT|nr:MAG: hypothetical protein COV91_03645 [Candidatus Taylorbacteria bacterium CG11_big_fil_rev_8_21_14_0_20_46_11]
MLSLGITVCIVLFWLTGIVGRTKEEVTITVDKKGPIDTLGETFGTLFADISDALAGMKEGISSTEVLPAGTEIINEGVGKEAGI